MNSQKTPSILIIGCGWLGKKLGSSLTSENYKVYGTTRSSSNFSELSDLQIKPVKFSLPEKNDIEIRLPVADKVIISLSPGRGKEREQYVDNIKTLARYLSDQNADVIMYSSTSVYNGNKKITTETDSKPDLKSDNIILAAEATLLEYCPDSVILRLCGLYGDERHPATYMAGRKNIADGDAPVNLVHRDDVIQVTKKVIENNIAGKIYNVGSSSHPAKKEIYSSIINRMDLKKAKFADGGEHSKIVSSEKMMQELKITLKHPDPADFLAD